MNKDIRLTVRIEEKTHKSLIELAEKLDVKTSWIIRTAIKRYVAAKRKTPRI